MTKRDNSVQRAPLTRELIASVAAELIKTDGIEALTMRSVAAKLGVSAMALYHHVADKDEITRLVGDDILGHVTLPDPGSGDWRQLLTDTVHATHEALLSVPGMTSVVLTGTLLPNARRILFFCIHQFERAGLNAQEAKLAYAGLHQLSIGRLMIETSPNFDVHTHTDTDDELAVYMNTLHSRASFDEALAGLLNHYASSARRVRRSTPRKALPKSGKAVGKRTH